MTYDSTVDWLYNQLPAYQNEGIIKYKLNLSTIKSVCSYLGNPQSNFNSIHIAGTNGKGSSSHMISSVLQESGCKVGLYTSPHLIDFRERIKINGSKIPKSHVVKFVRDHKIFFEKNKISFFEMTVAMAFDYFSNSDVDLAVIETGMGGRLDATNILRPILSLITNVGLDHQEYLGKSLRKIANEKAGIIKKGIPVVISEYQKEIEDVFRKKARSLNSQIFYASDQPKFKKTDLRGTFQLKNLNGVVQAISLLKQYKVKDESIVKGLNNVKKNTGLSGRWEIISEKPLTILDVGHNSDAFKEILKELKKINYSKLRLVLAFTKGKDYENILNQFPTNVSFYFCKLKSNRSQDMKKVFNYANKKKFDCKYFNSVDLAYENAHNDSKKTDLIFVGGSTFTISEFPRFNY